MGRAGRPTRPDRRTRWNNFGLALPCDAERPAATFTLHAGGGTFRLSELLTASCTLGPDAREGGSHAGTGMGTYAGQPARVEWLVMDSGENSGRADQVSAEISGAGFELSVSSPLSAGSIRMGWTNNHSETLLVDA